MKHHKIAICLAAAITIVGLSACSARATEENSPVDAESSVSEAAPAESSEAKQTVAEACAQLTGPLSEASSALAGIASAGTADPQAAVDTWTGLADAFGAFADSVANDEVEAAARTAHTDLVGVRDAIQHVYVDGNTGAIGEFTTATTEMQESYTAVLELCAG